MPAQRKVRGGMQVRSYLVFARAVEEGVQLGWNRAHKHTDEPSEENIKSCIEEAVIQAVCEFFTFDEQDE